MVTSGRCHFLELPVEVRLVIYDSLASFKQGYIGGLVFGSPVTGFSSRVAEHFSKMPTYLAITRVSRQIRTESVPTMYSNIDCCIWNTNLGKSNIHEWLTAVDPQAVASVFKISLFLPDCEGFCYFAILPGKVNREVEENGYSCIDVCPLRRDRRRRDEKRMQLEKLIEELPLVRNGTRRKVTIETIAAMLKVLGVVVDAVPDHPKEAIQTD